MAHRQWLRMFLVLALLLAATWLAGCGSSDTETEASSIVIVIPEDPPRL